MTSVLLLEDEKIIANQIKEYFLLKEVHCDVAHDGDAFLKMSEAHSYNSYLLDINVPKTNGIEVCRIIRERGEETPIIMLTALGEIEDKVMAFSLGADDYLVKPFLLEELFIRVQALLRRKGGEKQSDEILVLSNLKINVNQRRVWRANEEIKLTPKEFKLLLILANAPGRVFSKQQIAESLWDYRIETNENTIEVYINFLRRKIDKNFEEKLIHTKIGFGYYLKHEE